MRAGLFMVRSLWRVGLAHASVITIALAAVADVQNQQGANGEAVKMSPYEVSANSVGFEGWIKLRTEHYILYTDASVDEATNVLRELEMVHVATQYFFRRPASKRRPVVVVLPCSWSDWRKIASKGNVH